MNGAELLAESGRWIRFARDDLKTAEKLCADPDLVPRQACFLAQQAAEKAIKAGLVVCGVNFPRIHDLNALRNLLPDDWAVRTHPAKLGELSSWAVEGRYPVDLPDATREDAQRAVAVARAVYDSVCGDLGRSGLALEEEEGTGEEERKV